VPTRRRFIPRFSLAAALFAMTLCAVGLWYWYRVPFEVVHDRDPGATFRRRNDTEKYREVETVRRTWDGTVRHGPRHIFLNEKLFFIENYRDGVPHGKWEWLNGTGRAYITAEFRLGRLTSFQASKECDQRLARLLAEGVITDRSLIKVCFEPTRLEFTKTPLKDAIQIFKDRHNIEITCQGLRRPAGFLEGGPDRRSAVARKLVHLDSISETERLRIIAEVQNRLQAQSGAVGPLRIIRQWDLPITLREDAEVPLIVALGKMLQPHDLVCDYRYGMLWIAEREEAEKWTDPTGTYVMVPPANSKLAAAWEERRTWDFIQTPLADACDIIAQSNGVRFDLTRVPGPPPNRPRGHLPVTWNGSGLQFKHSLGAILESVGCRARLDGETIVIEMQPDHPESMVPR
jgi:hypothetical protein